MIKPVVKLQPYQLDSREALIAEVRRQMRFCNFYEEEINAFVYKASLRDHVALHEASRYVDIIVGDQTL